MKNKRNRCDNKKYTVLEKKKKNSMRLWEGKKSLQFFEEVVVESADHVGILCPVKTSDFSGPKHDY